MRLTVLATLLLLVGAGLASAQPLDTSFADGGVARVAIGDGPGSTGYDLAYQADGRIVVAVGAYAGARRVFHVVRFETTGSLDTTFGNLGVASVTFTSGASGYEDSTSVAVDPDDRIVVAGWAPLSKKNNSANGFAVARFLADGSLDTGFGSGGKVLVAFGKNSAAAYAMTLDASGRIVLAGHQNGTSLAFARLTPNGALDTTFDGDGRATVSIGRPAGSAHAAAVAVQADGKIVGAGLKERDFIVVRLNDNGSRDTSFDGDGVAVTDFAGDVDEAHALVIAGDDCTSPSSTCSARRILVGGRAGSPASSAEEYAANTDFALASYTDNGSPDTDFGTGGKVRVDLGGTFNNIRGMAFDAYGRLVVAGPVKDADYTADAWGVGRFNSDGTLDGTFGTGGFVEVFYPYGAEPRAVGLDTTGGIHVVGGSKPAGAIVVTLARFLP